MCCKTVKLNIFCSKTPFELTIMSCDGRVIKNRVIKTKCTTIYVHTRQRYIRLFAWYNNQTVYHKICLTNAKCQNIFVNFAFKKVFSKMVFSIIKMTDSIYGLPVKSASFKFTQQK